VLVAVASDGAGSAGRSQVGSRLICDRLLDEVTRLLSCGGGVEDFTREYAEAWLSRFQSEVRLRAEAEGLSARDYACTLLAAIVAPDLAVLMQLGDGVIVVSSSTGFGWAFWPERGEYANTTFFATDPDARDHLQYDLCTWPIEELAILTDGLQHLALVYQTHEVHLPFVEPMLAPVREGLQGHNATLSASLAAYLASPLVNDRTDDDKTLILATRRMLESTHARSVSSDRLAEV